MGLSDTESQSLLAEVRPIGLTGTPTFLIDGQRIVGAQAYSVFANAIDATLAER